MQRLTTAIVMILCLAAPAQAEVYDPFIVQLRDQGYSSITVGRTWLGRIVINAKRDDLAREIVLNARTGEILGDQANLISAPIAPQYSVDDDSDSDNARTATAVIAPDNTATATSTEAGDERAILDTGVKPVAPD